MKKTIALMMILGGGLFAAPRISVGIGFGAPAPVAIARPACPGPGYSWVDGYYEPSGVWTQGYWAPPAAGRENFRDYDRDHDSRNRDFRNRDFGNRDFGNRDFGRDGHFDRDHGRR